MSGTGASIEHFGKGSDLFDRLMSVGMDAGALRPYRRRKDGKTVVSVLSNKRDKDGNRKRVEKVLANADTTLTKEAWLNFDQTVIDIARERLTLWNDLRGSAPPLVLTDGLGTTILEQQRRGDITPATQSMDGMRRGMADQPEYDKIGLPLPITHKDFDFSVRDIAVSARGGQPLDMTNVEMAAWHVANAVDDAVLGAVDPFEYGGYSVWGYLSWPDALTGEITDPTDGGWTPDTLRNELLVCLKTLLDVQKTGPFDILYGKEWMPYMGKRYSADDSRSLKSVLTTDIEGISNCTLHTKIPGFKLIIKERSAMTARAVIGMEIQTVQWETMGGMRKNFKVMCIMVPQLRCTITGQAGVLVADTE